MWAKHISVKNFAVEDKIFTSMALNLFCLELIQNSQHKITKVIIVSGSERLFRRSLVRADDEPGQISSHQLDRARRKRLCVDVRRLKRLK
jgi:hypothetical protein